MWIGKIVVVYFSLGILFIPLYYYFVNYKVTVKESLEEIFEHEFFTMFLLFWWLIMYDEIKEWWYNKNI